MIDLTRLLSPLRRRKQSVFQARLPAVNAHAESLKQLSDDELRAAYQQLRQQHNNGAALNELLPYSFAITREAAQRTLGMRHFDAQILGGMALFGGNIAEMKTGEGKTLVATLAVCLEALAGKGIHVVTVNAYLAQRDCDWMGALYHFLGLSVGVNLPGLSIADKTAAYQCDVTYGTNNEFGFDYLRDNMRYEADAQIQRALNYAIVDEVDCILVDEARTPLIISGEADDNVAVYQGVNGVTIQFIRSESEGAAGDFTMDEKTREIHLTEDGFTKAENLLSDAQLLKNGTLYDPENLSLLHHLNTALRAHHLFLRDRDYVVQKNEVIIVDEFTGRLMPGRRWGDNLHQAVEAKENVAIQKENRTLASISFQNYFRLYNKLAGMTGTAMTEAEEFRFIYGLEVVDIPTHRKMIRNDSLDRVYRTSDGKYREVIKDIQDCAKRQQPVLVGTTAIEDSEKLSAMLKEADLPHKVLNAKQHEHEAHIIAQAGSSGAITIATNMAGRGTDIVLGGNITEAQRAITEDKSIDDNMRRQKTDELQTAWQKTHDEVLAAGGLKIIGTERHESRRIDNQLRGRSGRQGDPGESAFYLSFEDSLLRVFATSHVSSMMKKLNIEEDEAIEARMVSRTIEGAQRKVEAHNFDIRRQLLEYDDIANEQRQLIYEQREHILNSDDVTAIATDLRTEYLRDVINQYMPPDTPEEEWRVADLEKLLAGDFRLHIPLTQWLADDSQRKREHFVERVIESAEATYAEKIQNVEKNDFERFLRSLILNIIDDHWRAHISTLDDLRRSIGLRGMAQKNPKQEYKREAFEIFQRLLVNVKGLSSRVMYALAVRDQAPEPTVNEAQNIQYRHDSVSDAPPPAVADNGDTAPPPNNANENITFRRPTPKIRRNDPCPCGSGKKYKQCCGKL